MTNRLRMLLLCAGSAVLLSACTTSFARLSTDFGVAIRQDEAAQVANPDARYVGIPTPGSNGQRAELAQTRYTRNQVIPPASIFATQPITAVGGAGAGLGTSQTSGAALAPAAGQ